MPGYLRIHQDDFDLLDKYCNVKIRPAELALVMDRIIRPWTTQAAPAWARNPRLIPQLPKVPECKRATVPCNTDHAKFFRNTVEKLNMKFGIQLDPDEVASWLTRMFCKTYEIAEKNKYRPDLGSLRKF